MKRNRSDVIFSSVEKSPRIPAGAAVLQEKVTNAITVALFRELARSGYAALSIEAVAKRAGVGKAAIYRRWSSKLAMVTELITRVGVDRAEIPDTGSLEGDVTAYLRQTVRLLRGPLVRRILPDLHAEVLRTPELAATLRAGLQTQRRAKGEALLRRAITRGELAPTLDFSLALDLLIALLYWRLTVTGAPITPADISRLTAVILSGLHSLSE